VTGYRGDTDVNTLAQTDTVDAIAASLPQRAISQQAAVMALMTLISPGLNVPEANVEVNPSWPQVTVSVHRNPAGFEWWREALDLSPNDAGDLDFYDDLGCCCVRIRGRIGSTKVCLIGYLPLPADTPNTSTDAA
jgi:hypothetical protein